MRVFRRGDRRAPGRRSVDLSRVVIVGGGIGGLTAALCFIARGWDVQVLERAPEIGEVGAGIQISANGFRVLAALGVGAAVEAASYEPEVLEMRLGRSGRTVFSIDWGPALRRRYGAPYLQIHRADLVEILSAAVEARAPGALRVGAEVAGYEGGAARLASGETVGGDLLVGADGLHSVVRTQMLGAERPVFTGNVAWRCVAPAAACPGLPEGACVWAGPGRHAVTYPIRRGELVNFVGIVEQDDWVDEGWSGVATKAETLALFDGWDARLTRVIGAAERHLKWGLFSRPPLPRWTEEGVALLGDACHPMLPSLAQGACQAIEDAWVLAAVASAGRPLADYEAARKARVTRIQRQAVANVRMFHRHAAPGQALTYGPMFAAGMVWPGAIRAQNDWVYRADPTAEYALPRP